MKKPLTVLHVIPYLGRGGVEQRRLYLARGMAPDGVHQRIVCRGVFDVVEKQFDEVGVEVVSMSERRPVPALIDVSSIWRVYREIRRSKPDVVHCAVFEGIYIGGIAAILAGHRGLVLEETSDLYGRGRSWFMRSLIRIISLFARRYIAVSPSVYQYLIDVQSIPREKAVLILNGVPRSAQPSSVVRKKTRASYGIPEDALVVGSVGRLLNSHKRFSDVVNAFRPLVDVRDDAYLLIVGDGPDRVMLETQVRTLGLAKRVIFTGYQEDTDPLYQAMDVFVLASAHEAFGLAVAEAMMHGLPVVATSVGGIPDIVRDGERGLLVPPGDVSALSRALRQIVVLPDLRETMGAAARSYAEQHLDSARYINEVRELYCDMVEQ